MAQSPRSEKAHENLAKALLERAHLSNDAALEAEAERVLRSGLALRPADAPTITGEHLRMLQTLAELLRDRRRFHDALALYDRLTPFLLQYPALPASLRQKGIVSHGEALVAAGRLEEALQHYERARPKLPPRAIVSLGYGNALRARGDHLAALRAYQEAVSLEPANGMGWTSNCLAFADLGRIGEALSACLRAVQLGEGRHVTEALRHVMARAGAAPPPSQPSQALAAELERRLPTEQRLSEARAWLRAAAPLVGRASPLGRFHEMLPDEPDAADARLYRVRIQP